MLSNFYFDIFASQVYQYSAVTRLNVRYARVIYYYGAITYEVVPFGIDDDWNLSLLNCLNILKIFLLLLRFKNSNSVIIIC